MGIHCRDALATRACLPSSSRHGARTGTAGRSGAVMPLKNYGVLACRVLDTRAEGGAGAPHFQIRGRGGEQDFRIAVNVLSQEPPSELLYTADEAFDHPVLTALPGLPDGFTVLPDT